MEVAREREKLIAFGIGSCVVVVCYDPEKDIAGMLHGILPANLPGRKSEILKYMNTGIDALVKRLIEEGLNVKTLKAKIFGGAKMFEIGATSDSIGERNIRAAKEVLAAKNIEIEAEDTGSNYGRTIEFVVREKKAYVRSYGRETKIL